jgi:hypothetical protein
MNTRAYEIIMGWAAEAGLPPDWQPEYLAGSLRSRDFDDFCERLAGDDVDAIVEGRMAMGLPIFC